MRTVLFLALAACKGNYVPDSDPEADSDTDADADSDTDADADTDSDADTDTDVLPSESWTDGTWTTTVSVADEPTLARTYTFDTDHVQRDGAPNTVVVVEDPDQPVLRSGSLIFDGLFALAVQEARQNSVSAVSDGAFANGSPVSCDCFQTGELWSWVWTRDTSYAADLGLAWLDPARTAASLRFKLSAPKAGGALRIVQDTGSGGSWPVSTDRAIWALGASAVLDTLEGADRDAFLDDALEAVTTTAQEDRAYVWDASDGLYRGEQSFLDWREQSYPSWTADDVVPIAEGKALSTNLAHWILLDAAARWSDERGLTADRDQYRAWADDLAAAIDTAFWQGDRWSTLIGPALDPSAQNRRDLLAEALATLTIAPTRDSLSTYPHGPHGPPVMWPQQPGVRIYHNRAQWPFVTAYGLRAASRSHNAAVFDAGAAELIRGAAINLSNMENAEWTTGEPWLDDGALSGPVVDSRRQLWSVAGYLSLVVDGLFGVRPSPAGLTFDPFVTDALRTGWLDDTVTLHRFPWHGGPVDLVLELPPGPGPLGAGTVTPTASGFTIAPVPVTPQGTRIDVDPAEPASHTAPPEPVLDLPTGGPSGVALTWASTPGAAYDVVRDGEVVATGVTSPWTDPDTAGIEGVSWCYALRARWPGGPEAAPSRAQCWWGAAADRVQTLDAFHFVGGDGTWSDLHGRPHYQDWGAPSHTLRMRFRPDWTGPHGLQLEYANGGSIPTGITASHKWFRITDASGTVAEGPIVLPHTGAWDIWKDSTLGRLDLDADTTYELELSDAPNMTDLEAMRAYTAGPGGGPDPFRFVDIASVKLLAFDGLDQRRPANALGFDGTDDLAAFPLAQTAVPGAPLQAWDAFALEWDDDFLYVAIVSEAFEDPYVPFVLYLEADPTGPAAVGSGFEYAGQTPVLPFTPTHAVAVRRQHDAADGFGPWSGVWTAGTDWQLVQRFVDQRDVWAAADLHTLALRIPRYQLGDPGALRLAGHVVFAQPANEWKDTVPAGHMPWDASGGTAWTVDLTGPHDATAWAEQ